MRLKRISTSTALLAALLSQPLLACKYSVRDVAFVDLGGQDYQVYGLVNDSTPDDTVRSLRHIATATLLDSNLEFELANVSQADHPALWLTQDLQIDSFPTLVLHAPDNRNHEIPLLGPTQTVDQSRLWDVLESVVWSRKRDALHEQIVDAFAVVMLVEGTIENYNQVARDAIDRAIRQIERVMPEMPKPVDGPPQVLVVSQAELDLESTLLWSLGFETAPLDVPQAAILVGRGRRLGPVLTGGLITQTKMQEMLALVGLDCECDLDRSWMQGPMIPARWDSEIQARAFKALGFDPEHPLVKGEISRILARGPNSGQRPEAAPKNFDSLFLGYSEETIDESATGSTTPVLEEAASGERTPIAATKPADDPGTLKGIEKEGPPTPASVAVGPSSSRGIVLALAAVVFLALMGGGLVMLKSRSF